MSEHKSTIRIGQEPIGTKSVLSLILLSVLWSLNSVAIKLIVPTIPPFIAAFLRFAPSVLLIGIFLVVTKVGLRVTMKQFLAISVVGLLMGFQIATFNLGAVYTTGGRVTLFIFSYPFYVSLIAPLFIREERLSFRVVGGSVIALAGLVIALSGRLSGGHLVGDLIELASGIILSFQVVVNKIVMRSVDPTFVTSIQ
jgi:drug/metabolite transporter (DMT)-like permease